MSTRRTFLGRAFGACSALFAVRGLSAQTDADADASGSAASADSTTTHPHSPPQHPQHP